MFLSLLNKRLKYPEISLEPSTESLLSSPMKSSTDSFPFHVIQQLIKEKGFHIVTNFRAKVIYCYDQ